jgi:hypothetical protein
MGKERNRVNPDGKRLRYNREFKLEGSESDQLKTLTRKEYEPI